MHLKCKIYRVNGFSDSSAGKEPAGNAGKPSSIPGSERSAGEGTGYPLQYSWASLVTQLEKESTCNALYTGDMGSITGSGRVPGGGQGNPLQYSVLVNSMDCNNPWGHKESETTK